LKTKQGKEKFLSRTFKFQVSVLKDQDRLQASLLNQVIFILPTGWEKYKSLTGEFDPGSGQTLAACLTHASRAVRIFNPVSAGADMRIAANG
jgi:hypothetical protein